VGDVKVHTVDGFSVSAREFEAECDLRVFVDQTVEAHENAVHVVAGVVEFVEIPAEGIPPASGLYATPLRVDANGRPPAVLISYVTKHNSTMEIFLETEHLVLRRFTAADADDLVELDADPEVMRFITGGRPTPREEIVREVLPAFLGYYERYPGYGFWAALERTTGQFVGWFHLRPAEGAPRDEVELGYRLRRSAWGKGYATEGSRALIDKGFAEFGVQRVVASTMVVNVASRRVMEKAGLRFVRRFHQPWPYYIQGEEAGDVEYALLRSQWDQTSEAAAHTG